MFVKIYKIFIEFVNVNIASTKSSWVFLNVGTLK